MEDYLKSYCSFLFIPNQTSNRTTFLIGLDDEGPIRIGNDTVFADCVGLVSVVVRKKTHERSWISSRISEIISGMIRGIIEPHFSPLRPKNGYSTLIHRKPASKYGQTRTPCPRTSEYICPSYNGSNLGGTVGCSSRS